MFLSLKTGFTGLKTVKHRFRYFITKLNYSLDILIKLPRKKYFQIDKSNHKNAFETKIKLNPSEARNTKKKAFRKNVKNNLDN